MRWMTPKQEKVYRFVVAHVDAEGYSPTIKEIADATNAAQSLAHRRVMALEKKGYLAREDHGSTRNIRIKIRF